MIKNCFKIISVIILLNIGCSAQKNLLASNIESSGTKQPIEDSILRKLQTDNDVIIAYAVENSAWIRSMDFKIIAQKNDGWKGYTYHKNLMKNVAGSSTSINEITVNKTICDSVLNYIEQNKAWNIKGDSGNGFCTNGNNNCNINDASGLRLWIITKNAFINPYYYAPEYFEKCCSDKQRALFVSIVKKIASIVGSSNTTQ